jgi:SET domain-containing protein
MVVEYIGEKVRQIIADIREETYDKEGVGSCYLFRLDKDNIIDATRCGGMARSSPFSELPSLTLSASPFFARFMNHCCEPNAYAKIIICSNENPTSAPTPVVDLSSSSSTTPLPSQPPSESRHIVIFANRAIQPGEEITYDYKFPIEDNKLKCYCGAPKCQGTMN